MGSRMKLLNGLLVLLLGFFTLANDGAAQGLTPAQKSRLSKERVLIPMPRDRTALPPLSLRAAPSGPVHCCDEWEESEGIMTLWWNSDLIDKLQQHIMVYIPVDNQYEKNSWISWLNSNGIPLTNIDFLFIDTNTVWTRDYGPWFIWDVNNEMGIVDYDANPSSTYGSDDNAFPFNFAGLYGISYYDTDIEHVGGNWHPAGHGTAFSTTRVYSMNPYITKEEIDHIHKDYLGIDHYRTVPVAPWTIEHLDCWAKPANPATFIVVQYGEGSDYYQYAEDINEYYETLQSPWGRPFEIFRLPMFKMGSGWYEFKPYMNSLVSNKCVFVPITGSADDQVAIDLFEDAYPGYEVVGVDHGGMGFNDALHCRTRNFMRRDPIRIYPMPPGDTEDTMSGYAVTAEVIPPNGYGMISGYPVVRWSVTGGPPFSDVVMTLTGQPDEYEADIPAQPQDTTVSFYIEARDDGARTALYPIVAPDGMMSFEVREDGDAPELSRFIPARSGTQGAWPPRIRTLCKDDMATPEVTVEWSLNSAPQPDILTTREEMCYWYSGEFPGSASAGDLVTYRVKATDNADVPNVSYLPKVGHVYCPVSGQGSVAVVDLTGRFTSGPYITKTLSELGIPYTVYTGWPGDWSMHDVWFFCLGVYHDHYIMSQAEADDLVAALQAGDNIYLESSDAFCWDPTKATIDAWFGVNEIDDGGDIYGMVSGVSGSIADGISMEYWGESAYMDEISAISPAKLFFKTGSKGRAVQHDAGTYRTVAVSLPLGDLTDGIHPDTRKELFVRILEYLGVDVQLYTTAEARIGSTISIRLEGTPGDNYLLFASLSENYIPVGYGVYRTGFGALYFLSQGMMHPSGAYEVPITIPREEEYLGFEVHLQAVIGDSIFPLHKVELTNRQVMTFVR